MSTQVSTLEFRSTSHNAPKSQAAVSQIALMICGAASLIVETSDNMRLTASFILRRCSKRCCCETTDGDNESCHRDRGDKQL